MVGGQWPWLGITILALAASTTLAGRDAAGGLLLSLTYYKPPLFVVALVVLLLARGRRFAAGFAGGASVLLALTVWFVGFGGAWSYLSLASSYTYGQRIGSTSLTLPPEKGMGLVAAAFSITGSMVLTTALLVPLATYLGWRSVERIRTGDVIAGLELMSVTTIAFSVQLVNYDLAAPARPDDLAHCPPLRERCFIKPTHPADVRGLLLRAAPTSRRCRLVQRFVVPVRTVGDPVDDRRSAANRSSGAEVRHGTSGIARCGRLHSMGHFGI